MRAHVLSVQEPWAYFLLNGSKSIELRTWNTSYRGRLYIHVTENKMRTRPGHVHGCKEIYDRFAGLRYPTGHICGYVDLHGVKTYGSDIAFNADRELHRYAGDLYDRPLFGFMVKDPVTIRPVFAKGHLLIWKHELEEKED